MSLQSEIFGGRFDFESVYDKIVERCVDGDVVVEIGSLVGRSACYIGTKIALSEKNVTVVCVDPWPPLFLENWYGNTVRIENPFETFCANVRQCGLSHIIIPLRMKSLDASKILRNNLAAVFVDGDHSQEACEADIEAWFPKVKPGGVLAGHDWDLSSVAEAVKTTVTTHYTIIGRSWWCEVP